MTPPKTPEPELTVEAELEELLLDFGSSFEMPYQDMHNNEPPAHQLLQARARYMRRKLPAFLALIQQVSDQRVREFADDLKWPIQADIAELEHENETLFSGGDDDWEDRARAIIGQKLSVLRQHQSRIDQTLSHYLTHKEQS